MERPRIREGTACCQTDSIFYDYVTTLLLTTYRVCDTGFTSWLRGAFSRNDPARRSKEWRPTLRREPQRREVRTPTARPHGVARAVAAGSGVPLPGAGFVGPHPKTATVERRERSRSPRDRVVARRRRDRKNECACRRSIHPSSGGRNCCCRDGRWCQSPVGSPADAKAKAHAKRRTNPGAATRRGNEQHCAV